MKIVSAGFVKSAVKLEDCPRDGRPEIAFVGRSNVGKSSMLNALLSRGGLAKTSKTPGKTRTINFFDINRKLYFVDLPGYGYASAPETVRRAWGKALTDYIAQREQLKLVVLLLDSRHKPGANDHEMLDLLEDAQKPTVIAATKIDKLNRTERNKASSMLRVELELDDDALIIPFSSTTSEGRNPLLDAIGGAL